MAARRAVFLLLTANPRTRHSMSVYEQVTSVLFHKHFSLNSCVDLRHKFIVFHLIDWREMFLKTKLINV